MANFCENCGKPVSSDAKYCAECGRQIETPEYLKFSCDVCGKPLKIQASAAKMTDDGYELNPPDGITCPCGKQHHSVNIFRPQARIESISPKTHTVSAENNSGNFKMWVIVIIIVIGFAGVYLSSHSKPSAPAGTQTVKTVPILPREETIADETSSIPSGKYKYYSFRLNKPGTLIGEFAAFGGSGNDIKVFVMEQDSFINWKNGHQVQVFYQSGQLTVSKFDVSLLPGTYVIVFDNTFSTVAEKTVTTKIKLREKI